METKQTKIYAEVLEESALEQFNSAMGQDFVVKGALMPDAHTGYSLPIGSVVATKGVVVPSWVGFDIGCGMCAVPLKGITKDLVKGFSQEIFDQIYKEVPVGFNVHKTDQVSPDSLIDDMTDIGKSIAIKKSCGKALGTLGGGNHFIEIGYDEDETVWIVIHSGSRGVGHGIATHYMKEADPEGKCRDGHHGFEVNSAIGKDYIKDLNSCLHYALKNRMYIAKNVIKAINKVAVNLDVSGDFDKLINRNHNHAELKDGLWVHRKGATHAEKDMLGVIPANMRDGAFIVIGKGCAESLESSSHGAGRVLGRKAAKRELKLEDFQETMVDIKAKVSDNTLDESPMAYKNIFDVMRLQEDLVEVLHHIKPLINIKG